MVLKIKFEKLPSNHHAQTMNEKKLYNEIIAKDVKFEDWEEFILNEMNAPIKYKEVLYKKSKISKNILTHSKKFMDVIEEELH